MSFFVSIKDKILNSFFEEDERSEYEGCVDNLIALGVLFRVVGEADSHFHYKEKHMIEEVLREYGHITDEDMPIILRSIEEAAFERIDLHSFTKEVKPNLTRNCKIGIIENLFRVACVDENISTEEHETIRSISGLFGLDHDEFINAKIKVKREFGMETI